MKTSQHPGELDIIVQMRKSSIREAEWFKQILQASVVKPRFQVQSSDTASAHSTTLEILFRQTIPPPWEQGAGPQSFKPKALT